FQEGGSFHWLSFGRFLFRKHIVNASSGYLHLFAHGSTHVLDTSKTHGGAAVQAWPHEEELGREVGRARAAVHIPIRAARGKEGTAPDDAKAGPSVAALAFGPVPDVAAHIVAAEGGAA